MYQVLERDRYAIYRSWSASAPSAAPMRIAVLKLDHVGDFWMALGPLRMLRDSFPGARITLVVAPWNIDAAQRIQLADEVVAYDFFARNPRMAARKRVDAPPLSDVLPGHFDLAIDLRVPLETRPLLQALSATRKAAIADRHAMPWVDIAVPPLPLKVRWSNAYRLAARLRLPPGLRSFLNPSYGTPRDNLQHIEEMLVSLVAKVAAAFSPSLLVPRPAPAGPSAPIVVAPLSNSALRDWPPDRFGRLVAHLSGLGSPISLVGRPENQDLVEAIATAARAGGARPDCIAVTSGLADDAFVNHLSRARLVVSNNSGAGHVAARMGVPTVGIYTASHLPDMWGFRGPRVSMLAARIACAGCSFDRPGHCPWKVRCKYAIEPEDVGAEIEALLAGTETVSEPRAAIRIDA
jgi:ADP-heptose:LPS heptosyltransferase